MPHVCYAALPAGDGMDARKEALHKARRSTPAPGKLSWPLDARHRRHDFLSEWNHAHVIQCGTDCPSLASVPSVQQGIVRPCPHPAAKTFSTSCIGLDALARSLPMRQVSGSVENNPRAKTRLCSVSLVVLSSRWTRGVVKRIVVLSRLPP